MLFASSDQDFFGALMFLALVIWGMGRFYRKVDPDVKNAAKGGIIRVIGRWLK